MALQEDCFRINCNFTNMFWPLSVSSHYTTLPALNPIILFALKATTATQPLSRHVIVAILHFIREIMQLKAGVNQSDSELQFSQRTVGFCAPSRTSSAVLSSCIKCAGPHQTVYIAN